MSWSQTAADGCLFFFFSLFIFIYDASSVSQPPSLILKCDEQPQHRVDTVPPASRGPSRAGYCCQLCHRKSYPGRESQRRRYRGLGSNSLPVWRQCVRLPSHRKRVKQVLFYFSFPHVTSFREVLTSAFQLLMLYVGPIPLWG